MPTGGRRAGDPSLAAAIGGIEHPNPGCRRGRTDRRPDFRPFRSRSVCIRPGWQRRRSRSRPPPDRLRRLQWAPPEMRFGPISRSPIRGPRSAGCGDWRPTPAEQRSSTTDCNDRVAQRLLKVSSAGSSDAAVGAHITVDEQVSESIDMRSATRTMLPKSYAQTSLDRRHDAGAAADRSRRSAADRVAGGAPTGRVDQGGPREVAARNGEALMRRRSVTVHRETASAPPAGADIAGRRNRCQSRRSIAVVGGWANDGHVGDEVRAVVTWR